MSAENEQDRKLDASLRKAGLRPWPSYSDIIFDILVKEAGANESSREEFLHWFATEGSEFRFGGSLGFGGKFWRFSHRLFVNCYKEDLTSERQKVIDQVNKQLNELVDNFLVS
jgi:hypothetical protein